MDVGSQLIKNTPKRVLYVRKDIEVCAGPMSRAMGLPQSRDDSCGRSDPKEERQCKAAEQVQIAAEMPFLPFCRYRTVQEFRGGV